MCWCSALIGATDRSCEVDPDHKRLACEQGWGQVGNSCRSLQEETPLSELTSREMAMVGGKFTGRRTWPLSPWNSAGSAPKSAHVSHDLLQAVQVGPDKHRVVVRGDETK
jgi:hypothetical protein